MTYSTIQNYDTVVKLADKEYMQSLVDEGLSHKEMARRIGVAPNTIGKWLRSHKIERSRVKIHNEALAEALDEINKRTEGVAKKH